MKLLVIIVTYNGMRWAKRCFDSLMTSTIVPNIFVIDNGSKDGTQTYIKDNYPQRRMVGLEFFIRKIKESVQQEIRDWQIW